MAGVLACNIAQTAVRMEEAKPTTPANFFAAPSQGEKRFGWAENKLRWSLISARTPESYARRAGSAKGIGPALGPSCPKRYAP